MSKREQLRNNLRQYILAKAGDLQVTLILSDRRAGFFSLFFQAIGAVSFARENRSNVILRYNSAAYHDLALGNNWWSQYFEDDRFFFGSSDAKELEISDLEVQRAFAVYGRDMPTEMGSNIVAAIKIRGNITRIVADFAERNFSGHNIVGIHYRGTDKVSGSIKESDRIPHEFVFDHIDSHFDKSVRLFVATDELDFLETAARYYGNRVISYQALRSSNGVPLHKNTDSMLRYKIGEDALIDCLLLSRCGSLVRTASNLSHACRFFNPSQKVTRLILPKRA